jgi:hypothetical protein
LSDKISNNKKGAPKLKSESVFLFYQYIKNKYDSRQRTEMRTNYEKSLKYQVLTTFKSRIRVMFKLNFSRIKIFFLLCCLFSNLAFSKLNNPSECSLPADYFLASGKDIKEILGKERFDQLIGKDKIFDYKTDFKVTMNNFKDKSNEEKKEYLDLKGRGLCKRAFYKALFTSLCGDAVSKKLVVAVPSEPPTLDELNRSKCDNPYILFTMPNYVEETISACLLKELQVVVHNQTNLDKVEIICKYSLNSCIDSDFKKLGQQKFYLCNHGGPDDSTGQRNNGATKPN